MKVMTDASNILLNKGKIDLYKQRLKQAAGAGGARAAAGGSGTGAAGRGGSDTLLQRLARIRQAISAGQEEVLDEAGNTIGTAYPPEYLEVLKELERRTIKQIQEEGGLFADTPESLEKRNLLGRFDEFLSGIFGDFNERIDKTIRVDESVARQMKKEAQRKEAEKKKKEAEKKKKDASRVRPVGTSGRPSEHYLPFGPSYGRPGLNR